VSVSPYVNLPFIQQHEVTCIGWSHDVIKEVRPTSILQWPTNIHQSQTTEIEANKSCRASEFVNRVVIREFIKCLLQQTY